MIYRPRLLRAFLYGLVPSLVLWAGIAAAVWAATGHAAANACQYRAGRALPDPVCTPGLASHATKLTIEDTYRPRADAVLKLICTPGYASSVRPSSSYTGRLKREQMAAYHATGPTSSYQEDHLIPLELGGDPRSPLNLWPQPIGYAHAKDKIENDLHREVCDGTISLWAARGLIATDWRRA